MDKKIKGFIGMLLIAIMLFGIVGCSSGTATATTPAVATETAKALEEATGTPSQEKKKVVFIGRALTDPFCAWFADEFTKQTQENYPNYETSILDMEENAETARKLLENCVTQKVDAIIMTVLSGANLEDLLLEIQDKGIAVVYVGGTPDTEGVCASAICRDYDMGLMLAKKAAEDLPENAEIVIFNGQWGLQLAHYRRDGFEDGLVKARTDVKVLEEMDCEWLKDKAMATMEDWLQKHPNVCGVIAANDGMTLGAIEAFKGAGKDLSKCYFYGIDGMQDACASIAAGELTASVLQDAEGMMKKGLEMIDATLNGQEVSREPQYVESILITKDNVADFID